MQSLENKGFSVFNTCPFFFFKSLIFVYMITIRFSSVYSARFCVNNDTELQLINNGYEILTIRIDEDVPENYDLINELEKLLNDFSRTLFRLTRKRAYLRDVTITLPRSWGAGPSDIERRLRSHSANIPQDPRIWIKNTSPRDNIPQNKWQSRDPVAFIVPPYTIKATPCGYPGVYIRISPELVLFGNETEVRDLLGPPDKLLAREWAKLRWGVYDETPRDPSRDSYYLHSNRDIVPTLCSAAIQGVNINTTDPKQKCDLEEALRKGDCKFEPQLQQQDDAYASILYRANLPFVDHYCDETSAEFPLPAAQVHASAAPTTHNLHCRGRSVWGVMKSHPDFSDGQNPQTNLLQPPPINLILQKVLNEKIVLVLDVSSSMRLYGRIELMQQAVGYFIDTVPLNTWIGIVCFARIATRQRRLTQVVSDDVRMWLKEQSYCNVDMGTSIGSGIFAAIRILLTSGPLRSRGRGGKMIILTDGVEHFRPKINETLARVKEIHVTITTMAFGGKVEKDLETLALVTNGRTYAVSSGEYGIDSELQEAFQSQQNSGSGGPLTIFSEEVNISPRSVRSERFFIDETIGKNTLITIFHKERIRAFDSLVSPDGQIFTNSSMESIRYSVDNYLNITYIRIVGVAQSGEWQLQLRSPFQTKPLVIRISVVSHETTREPLTVSPALLCRSVNLEGEEVMVIYVYLSLGELAVLNATVEALITRPLTTPYSEQLVDTTLLVLSDNGLDPDITANDGVYSGYFVDFTSSGRYMVKALARNSYGRAYIDDVYLLGLGKTDFPVVSFDTRNTSNVANRGKRSTRRLNVGMKRYLQSFNRVTSNAGAFVVENFPSNEELCSDGYRYFQKHCYKLFVSAMSSYRKARQICEDNGGDLAIIRSKQTFTWIMEIMGFKKGTSVTIKTWYGGMVKSLESLQTLLIDTISSQPQRDIPDHDLSHLVSFLSQNFSFDIITNFHPNLEGLSKKDINRLLAQLGLDSVEQLSNIEEDLFESFIFRNKRQAVSSGNGNNLSSTTDSITANLSLTEVTTILRSILANRTDSGSGWKLVDEDMYDVTLSEAKQQPKNPEPDGSGAEIPTCKWFQNGKFIASSGEVCNSAGRFLCEKKDRDRFPPSRIQDLNAEFDPEKWTLKLTWSAPGNDYTEGKADGYEIRTLGSDIAPIVLEKNFERGNEIPTMKLPASFGEKETFEKDIFNILSCPRRAIVDLIIALPPLILLSNSNAEKKLVLQFVDQILSSFVIDQFNVQVAAFATTSLNTPLINFSSDFNKTGIINQLLLQSNIASSGNRTAKETISFLIENGGRRNTPKVLLAITNKTPINFTQIHDIDTRIIVNIGNRIEEHFLWDFASNPGCRNSFAVEDFALLTGTSADVITQLCQARRNELHAVAIRAFDEAGHKGRPSNVKSFIVKYKPAQIKCEKPSPTPLPVAGADATTIGLSIGVPLIVILAIIGSVMLFGQIKKYKKKRKEKKLKQQQQEKMQRRMEARENEGTSHNVNNNRNNVNNNQNNDLKSSHKTNFMYFRFRNPQKIVPV